MAWKKITSIVLLLCMLLSMFTIAMPTIGAATKDTAESGANVDIAETGVSSACVAGSFNSWSTTANPMTISSGIAKATITLSAGTYTFKIVTDGSTWWGNGGTIEDTTEKTSAGLGWEMWSDSSDCTLNAAGGTYVFEFNTSTNYLIIRPQYTVTFKSDGTTLKTQSVLYGQAATAPSNPTKASTAQYSYTFSKWDTSFSKVTSNLTVNAVFTATTRSYTVTVQSSNTSYGTVSTAATTVAYGGTTTLTATPKTGYHLSSWAITSGSGTLSSTTALKPTLTVKGAVTAKATFAANTGKVTFSSSNTNYGSVSSTGGSTTYSGTKSSTATPSTGYYFTGWTISGGTLNTDYKITSGSTSSASITIQPITNGVTITCKANFSAQYVITTQVNYPVLGSVTKSVTYVTPGDTVTITASATTGNTFYNWTFPSGSYTYSSGSSTSTSITIKPSSNVTVQGNFKAGLNVTAGSGGTVSPSGKNYYTYNTSVTLTATPNTGYHFTGWTFTGTTITSSSSASVSIKVQNNTTAKATFAINTYTVKFVDYDGTVLKSQTVNHGSSATAPSDPTRTGYEFAGWSGTYTNVTSNQTVTATYNDMQYYLKGDFTGGDWVNHVMAESDNIASVTIHLEPGTYEFKINRFETWWGNGGTIVDTTLNSSSVGWEMYTNAGNCTLQAFGGYYTFNFNKSTGYLEVLYDPDRYTVTFFNWDGTVLQSGVVMEGASATPPSTPTKAGNAQYSYTFSGWDKSYTNVQSTLDITAQFTQVTNKYTVTFKNYDGTVLSTQSIAYGSSATAPSNPTRPATAQYTYTFTGWSGSYTNITGDVTVTAQYSSTVNKYTVTFKNYDGTVLSTQTVAYGSSATAPANPTRPATAQYTYTFSGWSGSYTNITGNVTVTAQYTSTVNKYTVTFKDWDGTVLSTQTIAYGSSATAPSNPTRTGYTFSGWSGSYTNITGTTTVTATYTINSYTVTFKDWDGSVLKTQTVTYGSNATAPSNPTRTGYTFSGWSGSYTNIKANTTITATYTINSYTVTFKDYDGTVLKTQTVNYGSAATAPSDPYRVGYKFTDWDKDFSFISSNLTVTAQYEEIIVNIVGGFNDWSTSAGKMTMSSDKIYTLSLKLNPGSYEFKVISDGTWLGNWGDIEDATTATSDVGWEMTADAGDCTLNASGGTYKFTFNTDTRMLVIEYEPIYYTVVFKNFDGTTLSTQTVAIARAATAPATNPTRPATAQYTYTFSGWDTDFSNVQSDLTVTATYTATVNNYTVTFKDWDGTVLKTQTVAYGSGATAPTNPTRTGYTFSGWSGSYTNITGNTTITATYTINSYTVTFKDYDGRTLKTQSVNYGSAATPPTTPTRTGYTFAGWDKAYTNITANTTITATYTINSYTVTFKDWNGTTLATRTVDYGGAATAPADPTRSGYKFTGWDKTFTNITANLTVTAQYSEIIVNLVGGFNGWDTTAGKMTMSSDNVYTLTLELESGSYLFKVISDGTWLGNYGTIENTTAATSSVGWEMAEGAGNCTLSASGGTYTFNFNFSTRMLEVLYDAAEYEVIFKDYDGTVLKTQTVEAGTSASAPSNPTRTGYTFAGWDKDFTNITGNTTVTATYTINSYTVTFKDYDGTVLATRTVNYGSAATAPEAPARSGYKFTGWDKDFSNITSNLTVTAQYEEIVVNLLGDFNGWSTDKGKMTKSSDNVYTMSLDLEAGSYLFKILVDDVWYGNYGTIENTTTTTSDVGWEMVDGADNCTLKASGGTYTFTFNTATRMLVITYEAARYTVTFKDYDGTVLKTQTVDVGTSATAPSNPTRTGYTFTGWDKAYTNITADTVVTATYTINSYTVTFKDWNGTVLKSQTVEYGKDATAPADPVRSGYKFTGWDKAFTSVSGNLTVTAQYSEIIVNLLGDFNGWNTTTGKMTMSSDNVYTISLDIEPGTYKFKVLAEDVWYGNTGTIENTTTTSSDIGWEMTTNTDDCTLIASGGAYTFTYNTSTKMLVVTYEADRFTVTFKDWDGRVIKAEAVEAGKSATAPADPVRTGYTFTGWDKDFSNITGGLTVTAQYTINYYTVKFVDWDGTVIKTETVAYGNDATAPADPTRESDGQYTYTFSGWDKAYTDISADTTITATYSTEGVYYTVTFTDFDGTVLKTETVAYGASATAPESPVRTGYTFAGWSGSFTNIKTNTTVTATYTAITYTVTFKDFDGTELDSQTVNYGNGATAPEVSARNGYKFTGWDKDFSNVTSDLTVTAQYEEIVVNLLGDFNGWSTDASQMTLTSDNIFTMSLDLEAGTYLFKILTDDIWYGNGGTIENTTTATSAIGWEMVDGADNCTLTASGGTYTFNYNYSTRMLEVLYEAAQYEVTFKDWDGTVLGTQTVEAGKSATAPSDPSRTGYTFTGWDKEFTNITADTTVTATYSINSYTVTFKDFDGTTLSIQTVEYGKDATAPETPVRDGYLFTGWDTDYTNITASITVTATYKEVVADDPNVYLVGSFNDWATNTVMTQSGDIVTVTVELEPGTYLFKILTNNVWYGNYGTIEDTTTTTSAVGWEMVDGAGNCTLNATGGFYTFNFNTSTKMLEVLCVIDYFTVTFVNYDGTVIETQSVKKGSTAIAPAEPSRDADVQYSYIFAGWDTDFSEIQGETTVTATYTQILNKYTVTFVNYDGAVLKTEEVEYGKSATAPADPTRPANGECIYTFAGWDKDFSNITGDITVTAQYTAEGTTYTVIFKDWDGTVLSTQSVVYGTPAVPPADPTRTGTAQYSYVFTGWDAEYGYIIEDTTLTAVYTPTVNTYTVTFTNYDGSVLKAQLVAYGTAATAPANPERPATAQYTYTFAGWDKDFSCITGNTTVKATYTAAVNNSTGSTGIYNLANEVQQGQILQCWCWSYNNIRANLQTIASQGFSAIQVSPIQPIKESTTNGWNTLMNSSWVIYQPVAFNIETNSFNAQGTKSEFQAMCTEAHKYGIKVIVDTVFNHTANDMTENTIHPWVPSEIKDNPDCWHDISMNIYNFDNRYDATHYCLSGLPDLNTAHPTVQSYAISFMKEAIAAGADGFRFDAAKHIETDWDYDGTKSDFWMNVLGEATSYAQSTRGFTPYYYGEILGGAGGGLSIEAYTRYMSFTETSSNDIRYSITQGNAAGAVINGLYQGESANKAVMFTETHDTYKDSGTRFISDTNINKTWAIVGARAEVCGLYMARPYNIETTLMGEADITSWSYPEVKAVNQFKNHFVGQSEYLSSYYNLACVERGNSGIVIVNTGGTYYNGMTAPVHTMADGVYKDSITGNTFTVSGGWISGDIGDTGIAVVYQAADKGTFTTGNPTDFSLVGSFNDWDSAANKLVANSDSEASTVVYLDAGTYTFKLTTNSDLWYSNTGTITDTTGSSPWTMYTNVSGNCTLSASGGKYTFTFNSLTGKLSVDYEANADYSSNVYLKGSFNDWGTGNQMYYTGVGNIVTTTMELEAGTYTFKLNDIGYDVWYSNTGTINDTTATGGSSGWNMTTSVTDNCTLVATGGTYTFSFNMSTHKLVVLHQPYTYTVVFKDWDGTIISSQIVEHGSAAVAPADPERENDGTYAYIFSGWDTDYSCITANTTITAQYDSAANSYAVIFKDYDGSVISSQLVEAGSSAVAPADPTRAETAQYSYLFIGWDKTFTNITADTVVTAEYMVITKQYTVTFKDYDGTVIGTSTVNYGTSAVAPVTPTREGTAQYSYEFSGWSEDFSVVTEDMEVIAEYSEIINEYTVTFTDYDGTTISTQTVAYGSGATAPEAPAREGYLFTGWDTDYSYITGTLYVAATYEEDIVYLRGDFNGWGTNDVMNATENDNIVSVTLTLEEGTYTFKINRVNAWYGNAGTIEDTTLSTSDIGWEMNASEETNCTLNASGGYYTFNFNKETAYLEILYTPFVYTVTFVDYDGTVLKSEEVERGNSATAPADPVRDGFAFTGWDVAFDNITEDITVTATYREAAENEHIVTFVNYDGTVLSQVIVENGKSATAPEDPARAGDKQYSYTFAGWDVDFSNVTSDMTVTATYTETVNSYTVVFVDFDGTVLSEQVVEYGSSAEAPESPEREADAQYTYTFTGWDTDFAEITEDVTITAQYDATVNTYTVTFVDWDGDILGSETVEYGNAATAPKTPLREGYLFAGWDVDLTVTAQYEADVVYLRGFNGDWTTGLEMVATETDDVVSVTLTLEAGTYSFKIYRVNSWYSNGGVIADTTLATSTIGWQMSTDTSLSNCTLAATGGTYTFNFNKTTKMLEVLHTAPSYTVTFVDFDGTVLGTEEVARGEAATAPENPVRDGFAFIGWDVAFDNITEDITVTATYKELAEDEHIVTFVDYGGTVLSTQIIKNGESAVEPDSPTREADAQYTYTFTGWDVDFTNITGDLTVTAQYDAVVNKYIVTFMGDDGTVLDTQSVEYGSAATAPVAPAREGYVFKGWSADFSAITGNITIIAQYDKDVVYLAGSFNDWSETGTVLEATETDDVVSVTMELEAGTYSFKMIYLGNWYGNSGTIEDTTKTTSDIGWEMSTSVGDNCTLLASGGTYTFTFNKSTKMLEVVFLAPSFTVTFVDWDGTVLGTEVVERGKAATAPADPVREPYAFIGWDKSFSNVTTDMTVTAQYAEDAVYLVGSWSDWALDTEMTTTETDGVVSVTLTLTEGTYQFKILNIATWFGNTGSVDDTTINTSETGWIMVEGNDNCTLNATGGTYTFIYNRNTNTLEILFTPPSFTVTFVDWDGTVLGTQTVVRGMSATAPADPEREGYSFQGWNKDFSYIYTNTVVTATYLLNEITYTVTFLDYDGTVLSTQIVKTDEAATAPEVPERENYEFVGWDKDFSKITYNLTVTARYVDTRVYLVGTFTDWTTNTQMATTQDGDIVSGEVTLPAGTHYFKILYKDVWYTNTGVIEDTTLATSDIGWEMITDPSAGNCTLNATGGKYTFNYNTTTHFLEIVYTPVEYTVTFVDHDGTELSSQTVKLGAAATAPEAPVREGYIFTGWDKDFTKVEADTVVTALYVEDSTQYTVNFVDFDGTVLSTQSVGYGQAAVAPTAPVRAGYVFTGWDVAFTNITGDTTVTAQYKDNTVYLYGSFNNWAEGIAMTLTENSNIVTYEMTLPAGRYFFKLLNLDNWYGNAGNIIDTTVTTSEIGWEMVAGADNCSLTTSGGKYIFNFNTSTKMLEVLYTPVEYKVVFKGIDGEILSTQTVKHGAAATAPEAPEINGYIFSQWDTDFSAITENTEVNAIYLKDDTKLTVTFVDFDGTVIYTAEVGFGESATAPADPVRVGYIFIGWDKEFTNITKNTVVTAQYKDNQLYLVGSWGDWATDTSMSRVGTSNVFTVSVALEAGSYEFKLLQNDVWYTSASTVLDTTTVTSASGIELRTNLALGNIILNATGGLYTFRFNVATNKLEVLHSTETFTVTFKNWDGTVLSTQTVMGGCAATAPELPTRESDAQYSYTFAGWDKEFSSITADITITAKYVQTVNSYTVTFLDTDGTVLSTQTVEYGKSATAPEVAIKEGFVFQGWDTDYYYITKDTVVTAKYLKGVASSVSLAGTFNGWNPSATPFLVTDNSDKVTLQMKLEEGTYQFKVVDSGNWFGNWGTIADTTVTTSDVGWQMDASAGDCTLIAGGGTYIFTYTISTQMLEVEYVGSEFKVTFVDWDGTVIKTEVVEPGGSATAPEGTFTRPEDDGYTYVFAGWDMDFTNVIAPLRVTAVYTGTPKMYTVKFVNWNGAVLKTQSVAYGTAATPPADPTRAGYVFYGWDGDIWYITGNTTFTAQFWDNGVYIMGDFNDWQGTKLSLVSGTIYQGSIYLAAGQYKFKVKQADNWYGNNGWIDDTTTYTSDVGWEMSWDAGDCTLNASGSTYTFRFNTATRMLEILYVAPTYTVTFKNWNGAVLKTQYVKRGNPAYAPADPTRSGYVFTGWDRDFSWIYENTVVTATFAENAVYLMGDMNNWEGTAMTPVGGNVYNLTLDLGAGSYKFKIKHLNDWFGNNGTIENSTVATSAVGWEMVWDQGDCTLNASGGTYTFRFNTETRMLEILYVGETYTVTFVDWDGSIISTQRVEYGKAATAPAAPVRDGYTFTGWSADFSFITGDTTIVAKYGGEETIYLRGTFNNWDLSSPMRGTDTPKVYTYVLDLAAGEYKFKINNGDVWFGNNGTIEDSTVNTSATGWDMDASAGDCTLVAQGGTYLFRFNTATNKLEVIRVTDEVTVTFVDYDGTVIETQTVKYGGAATAPTGLVRDGYAFVGWDKAIDYITESITVTALYKKTVELGGFGSQGGNILMTNTQGTKFVVTISVEAGTYPFQINYGGVTYSANSTFADETTGIVLMENSSDQCTFIASGGIYRFTFDTETKLLVVEKLSDSTDDEIEPDVPVRPSTDDEIDTPSTDDEVDTPATGDEIDPPSTGDEVDPDTPSEEPELPDIGEITHTVIFVDKFGNILSEQIIKHGESALAPTAPALSGYDFIGWNKTFDNVTGDLIITAQYKRVVIPVVVTTGPLQIDVVSGTGFKISIDGGDYRPQGLSYYNSKAPIGVSVTVIANVITGKEFVGWIDAENGTILSKKYTYTFVTKGNNHIKALYLTDYIGMNSVMFMNDLAAKGSGQILDMQYYAPGDEIIFPVDPVQVGFDFAGWNMTPAEIQAKLEAGEDVTVLALWTEQEIYYEVVIIGGTGVGSTDSTGKYLANRKVTLTAQEAPEGMKFAYWVINGEIKSYDTVYALYPSANTTAEAVFVAEDADIEYQILVNIDTIDTVTDDTKNIFYFSWYVPEEELGVTYVTAGILAVNKDNYTGDNLVIGTSDSSVYNRVPPTTYFTPVGAYTWTKTKVATGDTWVARAYVQYKINGSDDIIVVYSDIVEATK